MNAVVQRTFEAKPAVREAVGLLIGLVGPSSSGKTYSALRIASGIQRVVGGEIDVIDTENGRALYYADRFKFNHVRFGAPFSPLDYLEAVRFCARRGAKTVVIDSASHEHEGSGGVLEWHTEETQRLAKAWGVREEKAQLAAWGPPKQARRKFINELLQLNINLVLTFRAKEKLKMVKGKDPVELGWQPICGDEFMYEMVLQLLLKPGSNGVPSWNPDHEGERSIIKCPAQFTSIFAGEARQIDEDLGKALAEWAMGGAKPAPELDALIADYAKCLTQEEFKEIEKRRAAIWSKPAPAGYKPRVKEAADAAGKRISEAPAATTGQSPVKHDATSAIVAIRAAKSLKELDAAYEPIVLGLVDADGVVPPEVENAFADWRAHLEAEES
jgi:hypothetical protein